MIMQRFLPHWQGSCIRIALNSFARHSSDLATVKATSAKADKIHALVQTVDFSRRGILAAGGLNRWRHFIR